MEFKIRHDTLKKNLSDFFSFFPLTFFLLFTSFFHLSSYEKVINFSWSAANEAHLHEVLNIFNMYLKCALKICCLYYLKLTQIADCLDKFDNSHSLFYV